MDTRRFSNADLTPEQRLVRLLRVELEQEGADPSRWLEVLDSAIDRKAWTSVGLPDFRSFVASNEGLASTDEEVKTLVSLRHRMEDVDKDTRERMARLRQRVTDLLNPETKPWGANQHTGGGCITTSSESRDASYVIRRLKRDDPDLARRGVTGEVSAHAAAVASGIRKRRRSVPDDPVEHGRWITSHYGPEQIEALIDAVLRSLRAVRDGR